MTIIHDQEGNLYEFAGEIIRETDKAYLVSDGIEEVWLPKSETETDGDTFIIPEWMAKEKGLI